MKDEKDKPKLRNRKKLQNEKSHISQRFVSRGGLSDDEIKERMSQYRQAEDTSTVMHKTLTRRLVSKLRNYAWYYPQQSEDNPSLKDAWCYYEHMTLPRYREDETRVAGQAPERALPGESNTELYGVWSTPTHWLKDFGIGVGLYFTTLKLMAVIFFLAGCISIPNIMFYASDEYSGPGGQDSVLQSPVMSLARGTMICTKREFVACPTCTESQLGNVFDFAKTPDNTPLVLRTLCEGAELTQGMVNWASFIFMVIAFALIALYQSQIEIRFNEDQVTVTDYSIVVENPPPDATDPDVWRDFFEQFSEKGVTVVTIALNNEALVRSLAFRRHFRNNLRYHLPPGTNIDNNEILKKAVEKATEARKQKKKTCFGLLCNCTLLPILRIFGLFLKEDQLYERVQKLTPQIQELQTKKYSATKVFVTFETEAGQRNALTALTLSKWDSWSNNKNSVGPSSIFQDTLLKIQEPTEPDAVRWLDLSATTKAKLIQRIITLAITIGLVIASGFSINAARNSSLGVTLSSIVLTLFNLIIPFIVKLLLLIEKHTTEGGRQASLYYKIALFRWVNTAIIPIFISSFTSWIGNDSRDIIITINSVLLSELLLSPTLRLLDIITTYRKHYLAPREKTQRNMNSHFNGTHYNLAERYTDLTKVIFLCFFYSPLFPSIYFYCTAIFIQQYWSDKISLLRIWGHQPLIGPQVSRFSRRFLLPLALTAFAIVASYFYASFPYDNICDPFEPEPGFAGKYNDVTFANGTMGSITVTNDDSVVFCQQELVGSLDTDLFIKFPALPIFQPSDAEWMTDSQSTLTTVYGWTSVAALALFVGIVFGGSIFLAFQSVCKNIYEPSTRDQMIDFSGIQDMFGYVPQVKFGGYAYPWLCCDIDDIAEDLVGWNADYDENNLIYDVPYKGMKRRARTGDDSASAEVEEQVTSSSEGEKGPIFSIVKHYPPEWYKKNAQKSD